ncbi:unnamed protein product [Leuciscus chuanchicus]
MCKRSTSSGLQEEDKRIIARKSASNKLHGDHILKSHRERENRTESQAIANSAKCLNKHEQSVYFHLVGCPGRGHLEVNGSLFNTLLYCGSLCFIQCLMQC